MSKNASKASLRISWIAETFAVLLVGGGIGLLVFSVSFRVREGVWGPGGEEAWFAAVGLACLVIGVVGLKVLALQNRRGSKNEMAE